MWVVEGLKVYYLESRPHFIPEDGLGTFKRFPTQDEMDQNEIVTEPFFVNSSGNINFRVKSIVDQFMESVYKLLKGISFLGI